MIILFIIMENQIKFYQDKLPILKSFVNFIFTKRNENFFECYLLDFNINAIMPIQMLTKKKKIKSINKLTPLNKNMIGIIEDISGDEISISTAYIDKNSDKYIKFNEISTKHNILRGIFTRYCFKFNKNLNEMWKDIIYPLFIKKDEENIYDYFINNYNSLEIDKDLKLFIKDIIETKIINNFKTTFKLVSIDGIDKTIKLFEESLKEYRKYTTCDINLDYVPNFTLISNKEDNKIFFNILKENVVKKNLNVNLSF